jgi:hypothetical protein
MAVSKYQPQLATVYMGLAADTKPVAKFGDRFLETDTLIVSVFGNAGAWIPIGKFTAGTSVPSFPI